MVATVWQRARRRTARGHVGVAARLALVLPAVLTLSVALLAVPPGALHPRASLVGVLGFTAAFAVAEATQLHVEFRNETLSVSLSELPLVLGLFLAAPGQLIAARLVGAAFVFLVRRTPRAKASINLALFVGEVAVARALLIVFHATGTLGLHTWLATYAAVGTATCVTTTCLVGVLALFGSAMTRPRFRRVAQSLAIAGIVNTTCALVALVVVRADRAGLLLLVVVGVAFFVAYRGYAAVLQKHSDLGQLYELSRRLNAASSYDDLVAVLVERCRDVLRAESVQLRDAALDLAPGDAVLRRVVWTRQPVLLTRRSREGWMREWLGDRGLRDAILVPLCDDRSVVAVLQIENRIGDVATFTVDDVRLLETIAAHTESALRGSRLLEQLRHDARHDALTGLGNRSLLYAALQQQLHSGARSAVLLLDLDRFKEVNDSLGHHIGDLLLGEVARRLLVFLPPRTTIARLGGDEFALLLADCPDSGVAERVAREVRAALCEPFPVAETTLEVGASVGIALLPEHGSEPVTLLQHADVAMYAAKRTAAGVMLYSSDADAQNLRRLQLARELRRGIEDGELVVHYQPKANLVTGELVGVEALVRWNAPGGLVQPDEFIPLAEQTGLIGLLTARVLEDALRQVQGWLGAGHRLGVSVNLSARGLLEPGLLDMVTTGLAATGVPPELLTLEITESSVMDDFAAAVAVLETLTELGVMLSLDDFGTGYSSLAYLQRLPVDEVKIDKSFVMAMTANEDTCAIVRLVIDLAHTLGLSVVAEGVEDETTRDALRDLRCDAMQGYLLARPLPVLELSTWVRRRTQRIPEQVPDRAARRLRVVR